MTDTEGLARIWFQQKWQSHESSDKQLQSDLAILVALTIAPLAGYRTSNQHSLRRTILLLSWLPLMYSIINKISKNTTIWFNCAGNQLCYCLSYSTSCYWQVNSGPSSLLVAWATPECNGEPITAYHIEISGGHLTNHMINLSTVETQYTITDLKPSTHYRCVSVAFVPGTRRECYWHICNYACTCSVSYRGREISPKQHSPLSLLLQCVSISMVVCDTRKGDKNDTTGTWFMVWVDIG